MSTVNRLYALAEAQPTTLVARIEPGTRTERVGAWAILRALGKRPPHGEALRCSALTLADAEPWLVAHDIRELILLHTQRLNRDILERIADSASRANAAVTFACSRATGSTDPNYCA